MLATFHIKDGEVSSVVREKPPLMARVIWIIARGLNTRSVPVIKTLPDNLLMLTYLGRSWGSAPIWRGIRWHRWGLSALSVITDDSVTPGTKASDIPVRPLTMAKDRTEDIVLNTEDSKPAHGVKKKTTIGPTRVYCTYRRNHPLARGSSTPPGSAWMLHGHTILCMRRTGG